MKKGSNWIRIVLQRALFFEMDDLQSSLFELKEASTLKDHDEERTFWKAANEGVEDLFVFFLWCSATPSGDRSGQKKAERKPYKPHKFVLPSHSNPQKRPCVVKRKSAEY